MGSASGTWPTRHSVGCGSIILSGSDQHAVKRLPAQHHNGGPRAVLQQGFAAGTSRLTCFEPQPLCSPTYLSVPLVVWHAARPSRGPLHPVANPSPATCELVSTRRSRNRQETEFRWRRQAPPGCEGGAKFCRQRRE